MDERGFCGMERIAAVVVTYNRAEKLARVLAALAAQTLRLAELIVVDNASDDETAHFLETLDTPLKLTVLRLEENTGGAGGFSHGMRKGYELGCDFVWVMDDDGYPEPDALEKLVNGFDAADESLDGDVPFACSLVKFIDGEICEMNNPVPTWDWGRLIARGLNSVLVTRCSFVSVLIPRRAIERFGLPFKEYFIWFDDAEYTLRLTRGGCPGVQVLDSVTVHDMGENKGVNFGHIDKGNVWKFEYGVRNEASFWRHHGSLPRYLFFVLRVVVGMRRGGVSLVLQRRIWRALLAGARFNPTVDRVV